MNPVISRKYVEENYVHKDKIREAIKFYDDLIKKINNEMLEKNKAVEIELLRRKREICVEAKGVLREILEE